MKKFLLLLLVLILCIPAAIGCTTETAQPTTPATIAPGAPATGTVLPGTAPTQTTAPKPTTPTTTAVKTTTAPKGPVYGGILRLIEATAPTGTIGAPWGSPFGHVSQQICEEAWITGLSDGFTFESRLTSYTVNADPKDPYFMFNVRKGVKFHDGSDLNAEVVKWSWSMLSPNMFASTRRHKSMDIVDAYTLKSPMTEWRNSQYTAFSASQHYIVSRANYELKGLDAIRYNMVGTGPFKQVKFVKDVSLETIRFDDYWNTGKPYLQGVTYMFVADELTRLALFKTGGAEVMNLVGNGRVAEELQKEGWYIHTQNAGCQNLVPDSANAESPWANIKVRQAAEYAIDKEAIAKAFGFGFYTPATQVASPGELANIKDLAPRKYDPAKAKQLLTEAGFPNGFKTQLIAQSTDNRDVCVAIQSQFKEVGIDLTLNFVEPLKFTQTQVDGWKNGLLFLNWALNGNPVPSVGFTFPAPRTSRYTVVKDPPEWAETYKIAPTTPVIEAKWAQKFTQCVYDDVMVIPIYWPKSLYAISDKVKDHGFGKYGAGYWDTANCYLTK